MKSNLFSLSLITALSSLFFQTKAWAQAAVTDAATGTVAAAGAPQATAPAWMQFVPFVVIIGVFYFFIIRPQGQKQKEQQSFLSSLKVGDLVITQAGIFGRITELTDVTAKLDVSNGVQIKILRPQIISLQSALQTATK